MGHTIMFYSLVATLVGLAIALYGKCLFKSKIICIFGATITTIAFGMCISLLSAYI